MTGKMALLITLLLLLTSGPTQARDLEISSGFPKKIGIFTPRLSLSRQELMQ